MKTGTALGILAIGGTVAQRLFTKERRERFSSTMQDRVAQRMAERMEHAMDSLPDDAPPKLVKRIIPKLEAQNEEILGLLREQNELLRQSQPVAPVRSAEREPA